MAEELSATLQSAQNAPPLSERETSGGTNAAGGLLEPLIFLEQNLSNEEDRTTLKQLRADVEEYVLLPQPSDDIEVRKRTRELWEKLATAYWNLLWSVVERHIRTSTGAPQRIDFTPEERLFLDFGFLDSRITPGDSVALLASTEKAPPLDRFQYYRLSDLIAEEFTLLYARPLQSPRAGMSLRAKTDHLEEVLNVNIRKRKGIQGILLKHINFPQTKEADTLLATIDGNLMNFVENTLRTLRVRMADNQERQKIIDAASAYRGALEKRKSLLDPLRSGLEQMGLLNQFEQLLALDQEIEDMAIFFVRTQEELRRQTQKVGRFAEKWKGKGEGELRLVMKESIKTRKMFMEMSAKRSHLDVSPLFSPSGGKDLLTFSAISKGIEHLLQADPGILGLSRIRIHGCPRVVVVPGKGNGVYNWEEHVLQFPLIPADTPEKSVAQAMALFRWDADDDRDLKDTYAGLKGNKGKSIMALQESFSKEYLLWVTKEIRGYRVLEKDQYKWFKWKIAGSEEE